MKLYSNKKISFKLPADDCLKDKKERREETDAISLELITEIISVSMLIFWEFLHADKSTKTIDLKGIQEAKIDLREPADSELILDIITNLQKVRFLFS